jgi:hypothetical protein
MKTFLMKAVMDEDVNDAQEERLGDSAERCKKGVRYELAAYR